LHARAVGVGEGDGGAVGGHIVQRDVGDAEPDVTASVEPGGDQVLEHLVLRVEVDAAAGERREVDTVAVTAAAEFDALVAAALLEDAVAYTRGDHEVDGALFEDAGADGGLDVGTAAGLDDGGVDPRPGQQVREHEAGRTGSDDADLGTGMSGLCGHVVVNRPCGF
jgi:hypothetical protein